ncbi:hypothetical protein MHPYR_490027 [uncultured Mycobacterium sp.]|uniref:DUF5666 domain-containing protein n=1 Tax=uncultured Mycobacterium sp. TaxID=171292 RepID=A0A1Y5PGL8_9MYCO|nr:hypothetical protein MHPYR_490027 [uncultured Mycobacterium sp.]
MASIAQSTVTVTTKTGPTTVDITPATKVFQDTIVRLDAVTVGSCVTIKHAAVAPGGPPAPAGSVTIDTPASNGECAQFTDAKTSAGAVTAINGQTVSVADTTEAPTAIPVNDKTMYIKRDSASALVITPGSCLRAQGTQANGGVLQVGGAIVSGPPPGGCPGVK